MPIDLKQSLLSGYHSIAGDYTAFSEREKSFPRENAQAACECCVARTWRVRSRPGLLAGHGNPCGTKAWARTTKHTQ